MPIQSADFILSFFVSALLILAIYTLTACGTKVQTEAEKNGDDISTERRDRTMIDKEQGAIRVNAEGYVGSLLCLKSCDKTSSSDYYYDVKILSEDKTVIICLNHVSKDNIHFLEEGQNDAKN